MTTLLELILPASMVKPFILLAVFVAVMIILRFFYKGIETKIIAGFQNQMTHLHTQMDRDFIRIKMETLKKIFYGYYAFWFFGGVAAALPHLLIGLALGPILVFIMSKVPNVMLSIYHNQRINRFGLQMVDALTLMANGLRSGLNISQVIDLVSQEMPNPISQEFKLIISETQLGKSVEESFLTLTTRIPTEDVEMLSTAINILRETGGNLAETFDTIVHTIRERIKIKNKISALVTQGIVQGAIIMMLPFGLAIMLYMIDPAQVEPMFTTPLGLAMVGAMLFLQLLGGLAIWKIIDVKV
jgi:tight adherence protein B